MLPTVCQGFSTLIPDGLRLGDWFQRLSLAVSTLPPATDWLFAGGLALLYGAIAIAIGYLSGFLKVDRSLAPSKIIGVMLYCLFSPAITEEVFFRVLLLPHPAEKAPVTVLWFWGCMSIVMFVIYHPLNALTFYPVGRPTFMNPVFLGLAGMLGVICTIAYLQSGSLWPPVGIHWLTVTIWLLLFGGYRRLYS